MLIWPLLLLWLLLRLPLRLLLRLLLQLLLQLLLRLLLRLRLHVLTIRRRHQRRWLLWGIPIRIGGAASACLVVRRTVADAGQHSGQGDQESNSAHFLLCACGALRPRPRSRGPNNGPSPVGRQR